MSKAERAELKRQLAEYRDFAARSEERGQYDTYWHEQVKRLSAELGDEANEEIDEVTT